MRAFISRIVESNRLLADDPTGSTAVDEGDIPHSVGGGPDYKDTIRRNLKNYNPELKRLVPGIFIL